jgi:hypothetical protein
MILSRNPTYAIARTKSFAYISIQLNPAGLVQRLQLRRKRRLRARQKNRLTDGCRLAGTIPFSSGLPVTLYDDSDNSLLGTLVRGDLANGKIIDGGLESTVAPVTPDSDGVRRLTLEQAKAQATAASNPLVRLGQMTRWQTVALETRCFRSYAIFTSAGMCCVSS